jgi:alginate O-acetyltransferase complex protein AlgJ
MRRRLRKILVGTEEPRLPKRSLPSYDEPTPETHRRLTREEEAELALTRTNFTPGTPVALVTLFVITILFVPAVQFLAELRTHRPGVSLPMFDVLKVATTPLAARRLPRAEELKAAEKTLESDSVVSQWLLPPVQSLLTGKLLAGNEQVYLGRDGWLFYRPDVDYVTGPSFLDPAWLRHRAHATGAQPDPVKAIVQFRDQLAARGIDLLIVPVPVKPAIEGEKLARAGRPDAVLQNAGFAEFERQLAAHGVRIFDPTATIAAARKNGPTYLSTDTHWRPETMEAVAQEIAAQIRGRSEQADNAVIPTEISGVGDLARMLKLPANEQLYPPEKVIIHQVTQGNALWRPNPEADVLLLGDSFSNIFSLEALGWGESAGFAEHLSYSLGRPVDCILRNSDGAFATREILARELARGRARLAGKKLVIWEFAARELAFGDWKLLEMKLGQPAPARFFSPSPGKTEQIIGTVETVSSVPRPGTVPYRDHIMTVQLGDVSFARTRTTDSSQAIVYLQSMRDNVWTPAARLRPGDRVTLRVRAWSDVSSQYEQINRSEIDDPQSQLEEPIWGELLR